MTEIIEISDLARLDEVCSVIRAAHQDTYQATGLVINTTDITPVRLSEELNRYNGKCLACIIDGGIIAGTISIFNDQRKYWYSKGKTQTIKYVAVRPDCQGRHIAADLIKYIKDNMIDAETTLMLSTDERNTHAIKLYEKSGFKLVEIVRGRKAESNAVRFAWWLNGCPFSDGLLRRRVLCGYLKCLIKKWARF